MPQKAEQLQSGPMQMHHGHTETHVAVSFSRATDHVYMTEAEALSFIKAVQESIAMLAAHKASKGN